MEKLLLKNVIYYERGLGMESYRVVQGRIGIHMLDAGPQGGF